MNYLETWEEMLARHEREKVDLVRSLSDAGFTQTEAANLLKVSRGTINWFAKRRKITWKSMQRRCYEN